MAAANDNISQLAASYNHVTEQAQPASSSGSPQDSFNGPNVNGRPTTVALFSAAQLAGSRLLPSLYNVINKAFRGGHVKDGVTLVGDDRLVYENQFLDELGNAPDTFVYALYYSSTDTIVGTASAKRYLGNTISKTFDKSKTEKGDTFKRRGSVPPNSEAWELSTMAVDPSLQRQGVAAYLMKLVDAEVKRRFTVGMQARQDLDSAFPKQLIMRITTIKEQNEAFYSKRGFFKDYEIAYPKGHLGSERGFTVIHMSKVMGSDEVP